MSELEHIKSIIEMGSSAVMALIAIMLLGYFMSVGKKLLKLVTETTKNHLTHIEKYTKETNVKMDSVIESTKKTEEHMSKLVDLMEKQVTLKNIMDK